MAAAYLHKYIEHRARLSTILFPFTTVHSIRSHCRNLGVCAFQLEFFIFVTHNTIYI